MTAVRCLVIRRDLGQGSSVGDAEWEAMSETIRAAKADRLRRLAGYEAVVREFEALLFERDPIGINFESNTDEYRAEATTIALRFLEDADVVDPGRVAYEEFARWFGEGTCEPPANYESTGAELWQLWTASL